MIVSLTIFSAVSRWGYSDEEIIDAFNVALVVGGSIIIPHLRLAFARLDEIRQNSN